MNHREIILKLEGLDGSLGNDVPELNRRYWEGYRMAMCNVIGVDKGKYPFKWEYG